jgi:DNA-binding XRE family transcriptional regulator
MAMDLDEYLWRHRIKQKDFAELLGVRQATVHCLRKRKSTPLLLLALNVVAVTRGAVDIESLLNHSDELKLKVKKELTQNSPEV